MEISLLQYFNICTKIKKSNIQAKSFGSGEWRWIFFRHLKSVVEGKCKQMRKSGIRRTANVENFWKLVIERKLKT